jgi:hypothetical protein
MAVYIGMNKKLLQFAKLIASLQTVINSDPYLNAVQKGLLSEYVSAVNANIQAGITKGTEMKLCMIRNSILEWRREALLA